MTSCILGVFGVTDRASGSTMGLGFLLISRHLAHTVVDLQRVCGAYMVCSHQEHIP